MLASRRNRSGAATSGTRQRSTAQLPRSTGGRADRLRLLASNVQAHTGVSNALMISASIRNDATFAQPYPVVTITLADAQGQRLAMRRLQPQEYLDDRAVLRRGLAPGATSVLLLEVADPGDKAVAFEFGFE